MTNSEFWRELKPIEQKFRPGALPEAYIANAPTEDDRFYAPLSETVGTRPLWISPSQNRWCDVLMCRGAGLVNRHYHPQQVFASPAPRHISTSHHRFWLGEIHSGRTAPSTCSTTSRW